MSARDRTLLEIFSGEQAEHVRRLRTLAEALAAPEPAALDEALRSAHTLKGAARAAGLEESEFLLHRLEALFARTRSGALAPAADRVATAQRVLDAVEDVLASALAGRQAPDISSVRDLLEGVLGPPNPAAAPRKPAPPLPGEPEPVETKAEPVEKGGAAAELIRVDAASVDELIRAASQMFSAVTAESAPGKLLYEHAARGSAALEDWTWLRRECSAYIREKRDDLSFAPVLECLNYAEGQLRNLASQARAAASAEKQRTWELRRRSEELYRDSVRVRMTPAGTVFGAFGAMVRDVARDERKEVDFRAEGLETHADRLVLQALKDPVMHLLRNAVSHGIEGPGERAAAGKPPAGRVRLKIDSRAGHLIVQVEDDGRGIDPEAVLQEAVRKGLVPEGAASGSAAEDFLQLIFRPGFSTSRAITSLAGRGMGLSVVEEAAKRLQGDVRVERRKAGASFAVSVPLSISTQPVLLVTVADHVFGLPARFVERLYRTDLSGIENVGGKEAIIADSRPTPLARLSSLLGLPEYGERAVKPAGNSAEEGGRTIQIAVLASGERRAGIVVDCLLEFREAVVKDLGLSPKMAGLASGGVPLEDGTVAVILDAAALLERFSAASGTSGLKETAESAKQKPARILVVDDSITTRSLERSILEAHGYDVRVAVDGVEALERLRAEPVDLVITDIMMPRMDGLQLLERMKNEKDLAHIPVVVVTSLERREDQEKGLSLGADAYIVKRKFDQRELLNVVRQIL